jgi:hypothetical protein
VQQASTGTARRASAFRPGVQRASRRSRPSPLAFERCDAYSNSNEPNCSCCLKSWLAVAGHSARRKTKSVKALHPTFQATGRTGSSPEQTALGAFNLQQARALPFPRPERQSGSSDNSAEALRGFGCRTRLRPARAKESGGEAEAPAFRQPLGSGGFTKAPYRCRSQASDSALVLPRRRTRQYGSRLTGALAFPLPVTAQPR